MEDKNGRLIFCEPSDAAGDEPFAISELTYLVRAIAKREDARSRSHEFELDCHHGIAEDLCHSLYFALSGRFPSDETLGRIIPRDPA
jgi:hypothetical protein